ncbi:HAMP domain-containing sensor histidine kinase [Thermopolyspora sp. NPDC052614]|uniref:sensor histidine kinase n=1 Tax=Thermopolyspora sp. NPDC052614 TaxID=3155682 RepID=UPI00342FEA03
MGARDRPSTRSAGRRPRIPRWARFANRSLRARLLLLTIALLAAGLLIGGGLVIGTLQTLLQDRVDKQLRPIASIASLVPIDVFSGYASRVPQLNLEENFDLIADISITYLAPDGAALRTARLPRESDAPGPELPRLDAAAVAARAGKPFDVPATSGGGRWRVIALPLAPRSGTPVTSPAEGVVVAASLDRLNATVLRMRAISVGTAAVLLALLAVAGWFAVRAGLRPLRRIEETAAAIAAGDLSRRVPELASPTTEVGRLARALNVMLGQVELAVAARAESEARMRRFVGDVSHELRTPLFGIKGFTELHRMGGLTEPGDVERTMRHIESESTRLARLVEDLLLLARLDEGGDALPMDLAPMDLRTLAADARLDLRALDPSRPIELAGPHGGPPSSAPVLGDEARLRQVVTNLVGNAVAHTPPGTPVRIGVGTVGDQAVLVIEDDGPGLTPDQAAHVFDRFYRVDDSRSRADAGGAGLGLSIARSLTTAHGGRLELRTAPGRGAAFSVVLPVAR